jgi:hypothetical protein
MVFSSEHILNLNQYLKSNHICSYLTTSVSMEKKNLKNLPVIKYGHGLGTIHDYHVV